MRRVKAVERIGQDQDWDDQNGPEEYGKSVAILHLKLYIRVDLLIHTSNLVFPLPEVLPLLYF